MTTGPRKGPRGVKSMSFQENFIRYIWENKTEFPSDLLDKVNTLLAGEVILAGIISVPNSDFSKYFISLLTKSKIVMLAPVEGRVKYMTLYLENLEWLELSESDGKVNFRLLFNGNRKFEGSVSSDYVEFDRFIKIINLCLSDIKKSFKIPEDIPESNIEGFSDRSEETSIESK